MKKGQLHSDFDLVHRYLNRDRDAGEELYKKAYANVLAYVNMQVKESRIQFSQVDEIVSKTLLKSLEKLDIYNGQSAFSTYVIGIAKNIIREEFRKVTSGKVVVMSDYLIEDAEVEIEDDSMLGKSPEFIVIQKERIELIREAISMLSQSHKQVLQLKVDNKMTNKQIGAMAGVGEDAVRKMTGRAIIEFKKNLEKLNF